MSDWGGESVDRPLFIATWKFGREVSERAVRVVAGGGSLLDAVEQGIWVAEEDLQNHSVGAGGIPNALGVVQLDAAIMCGPGHRAGSVAAVEGILHPISLARLVMERTKHVMLVGPGARDFALQQGMPLVDLLTEQQREAWVQWSQQQSAEQRSPNPDDTHDTITLLGLDGEQNLAGGCSTSGWGYKLPGRVGDSPIIGSGLYVDNRIGAAGATGAGENIMRYCAAFLIVELMRQGAAPLAACVAAIHRIAAQDPRGYDLDINFIAIDKQGRYGAAGTRQEFPFCVATSGQTAALLATRVGSW